MSRVRRAAVFESLDSRKLFAVVPPLAPAMLGNGRSQETVAPSTIAILRDPQPFPALSRDANGILRITYNGWNALAVTQKAKHQYELHFRLSYSPTVTGSFSGNGNKFNSATVPGVASLTNDANGIILTIAIPDTGIRRISWPRTRISEPGYQAAPTGQTPSDPAPGIYDDTEKAWQQRVYQQIEEANNSKATVAFFGDSHIERYTYYGSKSWKQYFPGALNLGISGDSTRQILYRINAGLFDKFKPKTLVMMFGTNNFNDPATSGTDAQIESGIQSVLVALRKRLPDTKLVMISMLPRNSAERNTRIQHVNSLTADYARNNRITFLDVYQNFTGDPIRRPLYFDETHLNAPGYRLLSSYLAPLI